MRRFINSGINARVYKIVQRALALNSMTVDQDLPTAGRFKVNVPSANVLMNNGKTRIVHINKLP